MTLHARIAAALGWPEEDTKKFPLSALRELVRPVSPKLTALLDDEIRSGAYVRGEPYNPRKL